MSKFTDEFEKNVKDIKQLRKRTKEIIKKRGELGAEHIHKASSVARIKKILKETK